MEQKLNGMEKVQNKKVKNATVCEFEGHQFKSKLELMAFKTLSEEGFKPEYETKTFILTEGFKPKVPFFLKNKKSGNIEIDNKKIISIKYTPDINFNYKDFNVYVEIKGRENDVYYLKKKLFRKYLESKTHVIFAEIRTKKELLEFIEKLKLYLE